MAESKKDDGLWMQGAVEHPGSFKAYCKSQGLTDKEGKVTPACIEAGKKSKNPTVRKRATLAETFAKHRPKGKSDLDLFDFIDDFPTYFGRITRAGPFQYSDGIKFKKYPNLKELLSRMDHAPLYGSRTYGSHNENADTTELVGFMHNWLFDDDHKDVFADIEYFKDIKELSDLKHPENLPISLKFNVRDPNSKVQDITDIINGAVSLNKLELDRCSSIPGYGSCTVSKKTGDFRDTEDSRNGSENLGSDGTRYLLDHDDWFDFMARPDTNPDETEQLIKNKINIAKVEDMGDNNKPHEGNPISEEIEKCLKSGKTEEECKLEAYRKERTGKEKVGNEQMKDDIKVPKKDFEALIKENEDLKAQLDAYSDFEEEFVKKMKDGEKQLKELTDFKEKISKKEEKRKAKKMEDLVKHLKEDHRTCDTFLENHNTYDFLKEFHKGIPESEKEKKKEEGEDFVPSLADFQTKLEDTRKQFEWMKMS